VKHRGQTPIFRPGLELSRLLYEEAVRPILAEAFPGLCYAAARIGHGSEVLGFDSERSADHEWGPRLDLFLEPEDADAHGADIRRLLAERLPKEIRGWPTNFRPGDDPLDPVGHMQLVDGPVEHRVLAHDLKRWLRAQLGVGTPPAKLGARGWISIPEQRLAEATGGAVFRDDSGELTAARRRLEWYPDQVWRYLLARRWSRISAEEAFVGRCAEAGDELGSAVVAARLVDELMHLCLLLGRRYAPYAKWLGSAFAALPVAPELTPMLRGAIAAQDYPARERCLCDAYELVAGLQNAAGLAEHVEPARRRYHGRPYLVLHAERFARALEARVTDPELRELPPAGG
jgi:Domain of unknown function (DUF4037)